MELEWDETKDQSNQIKHGIGFEEAGEIFSGTVLTWEDIRRDYGEPRYLSIGQVGDGIVMLVVVHTPRGQKTRIISARKANTRERTSYYAYLQEKTGRNRGDSR